MANEMLFRFRRCRARHAIAFCNNKPFSVIILLFIFPTSRLLLAGDV
jgi:hypothetical protein